MTLVFEQFPSLTARRKRRKCYATRAEVHQRSDHHAALRFGQFL